MPSPRYDRDFYSWAFAQAAKVRAGEQLHVMGFFFATHLKLNTIGLWWKFIPGTAGWLPSRRYNARPLCRPSGEKTMEEDELRPTIRSLKYADVIRETTRIVVIAKTGGRRSSLQHVYLPAPSFRGSTS
jgi:hypothetical protein